MKRVALTTGAVALLALVGSAQAIEGSVNVGKDYNRRACRAGHHYARFCALW